MQFSHKKHRLHILLAICTLLAGLHLTACSSPLLNEGQTAEEKPSIDVTVTNFADTHNSLARLISPDSYGSVQKYTVEGEDIDGFQLSYKTFTLGANGTGKITGVSKTLWNLTLHAYSDSEGTNEVLRAYAMADTRNGNAEVSFTLSPYNVSTPGGYDLTFTYPNARAFESVTQINLSICNPDSGNALYTTVLTKAGNASEFAAWTTTGYHLTRNDMPAGYYLLIVEFRSNTVKTGTYTDLLNVEPGLTTSDTVAIPDILNRLPDNPGNLKVYRVDSSLSSDSYNAVIRWEDNATNEEYYEITVYQYSNLTQTTGTPIKIIDRSNYATLSIVNGDDFSYAGGNILYGSTEYVLKLKTGMLYDFSICAVNSIGRSDEIKRSASVNIANDLTYGDLTGFDVAENAPYTRINTYAVTYGLGDGTWQTGEALTLPSQIMTEYYVYNGSNVTLTTPNPIVTSGTQDYPIAYLGSRQNPWSGWKRNGTTVTEIAGYQNASVFADYNITDTSYDIEFDSSGLSLEYSTSESGPFTAAGDGETVNRSACKYVRIAIDKTKNALFTRFIVYVNGVEQGDTDTTVGTNEYYTFASPLKGTYTVQIAAVYNATKYFSSEKTLSLN